MPSHPEHLVDFKVLYESPMVRVREYCCHEERCGPKEEEYSDENTMVLMRHGAFCKHFGRQVVTADVNQATFFRKGSTYRVSHPGESGDSGTVFCVRPRILNEIVRELDPTVGEHPDQPFPFSVGPCHTELFFRHRALVRRLERAVEEPLEPLWADATTLQFVADVLEAAFTAHGMGRKRRRHGTDHSHANLVEAAKSYVAQHLTDRFTLEDVAKAVHSSPFHLARTFQKRTGAPIHRYLLQLRLRAALEKLSDGADDLTAVALEFGFSSHSHFTDSFRRAFGRTPSSMRHLMPK